MNSSGKPKRVKLWKNSVTGEKKQKSPMKINKEVVDSISTHPVSIKKEKNYPMKKMKKEKVESISTNTVSIRKKGNLTTNQQHNKGNQNWRPGAVKKGFKRKIEPKDYIPNKKMRPVTYEGGDNKDFKKKKQKQIKQSQESNVFQSEKQSSTPTKKIKPDNMSRKDWKMLHLDKKTKSPKEAIDTEALTTWKQKHMKKKGKSEVFEIGKILKNLWEDLRRKDCAAEKKVQLLKQVCDHLKGRVKEFSFAHDTVRVLECVLALGAETHRSLLFDELKDEFLPLTKSKYGKFFVIKMLRYGTKQHKDAILKSFHGKVISLVKHVEAAEVLEFAFNECTNAAQRFELIQEFFGASYKFFKVSDVHSLKELIAANPEKKSNIIQNMKQELLKVLDKSVIKHSIVHHVLWQFMQHCDETSRSEIIDSLKETVPEILHTKDGSRVGMYCIWYGSSKDRKVIIKSMRRFVPKIAVEEHGHMVLLATFDAVDDFILLEKNIIKELQKDLLALSQNVHGKKVLIYLLSPRDPHFCHPDVINILKVGDGNEISKKDPEVRQQALKSMISDLLLELIKSNIQNLYTDNAFCLFTLTILKHAVGNREEAFASIADLLVEPYTTENKNTHPVEHSGSNFMLQQLIIQEQNIPHDDCYFSKILISRVPKCVLSSWLECNRGAFLLVSLLETDIASVVTRVTEELEGRKKYLAKKKYKGAEILLKKLKNNVNTSAK